MHVVRVSRKAGVSLEDCWDEAITALIRAAVHFRPEPPAGKGGGRDGSAYDPVKAFGAYARLAIQRGCWRYCVRGVRAPTLGLEDLVCTTSPEDILLACETVASWEPSPVSRKTVSA